MTVGEDSVQYRKSKKKKNKQTNKQTNKQKKKHCFLIAILFFIGKIFITYWAPWVVWKLFYLIVYA